MTQSLLPIVHSMRASCLGWENPEIPEDSLESTRHLVIYQESKEPIGITSYLPMSPVGSDEPEYVNSMRFLGFAVRQDMRGTGIGSLMMENLQERIRKESNSSLMWANARLSAVPFYKRHGFLCVGEVFTDPISKLQGLRVMLPLD